MPVPFMKHGRRHASGGEDPIPGLGGLKWAVASAGSTTVSKASGAYRMKYTNLTTNDSSLFELAGVSGGYASWLQINSAGYYLAKFDIFNSVRNAWGLNDTTIDPIYNNGGIDTQLATAQYFTDFNEEYNSRSFHAKDIWGTSLDDNHHFSLDTDVTFLWDGGTNTGSADLSYVNPLQIAVKAISDQTGSLDLYVNTFVLQVSSSASYTSSTA